MKHIYFIRHGESMANIGVITGDVSAALLSPRGHKQAEKVAEYFTTAPDLIVHSHFPRTRQTAEPLIKKFSSVQVETWNVYEFAPLGRHRYKDTTPQERIAPDKEYWEKKDPHYHDGDGAESFANFVERISDLTERLHLTEEENITIFTHLRFLQWLDAYLTRPASELIGLMEQNWSLRKIVNGEILKLTIDDDGHWSNLETVFIPE